MAKSIYDQYSEILQQIFLSMYSDLIKRYNDAKAVKKEIYNIGIESLKDFGARDPLADKIEDLLDELSITDDDNRKKIIKEKLVVLNEALKIISGKDEENNERN